jgi:hypothetical protein
MMRLNDRQGLASIPRRLQRVEVIRRHRIGARPAGKCRWFEQDLPRLELPEEPLLGGKLVVLVLEMDQVQAPDLTVERFDRRDDPAAVAYCREHADAGNLSGGGRCHRGRIMRGASTEAISTRRLSGADPRAAAGAGG